MASWEVLERHFDGMTAEEVDAELSNVPAAGSSPASTPAADYLAAQCGEDRGEARSPREIHRRRVTTTAATLAESIRSALTIDQAAEHMGISRSRVSHRLRDRTLWSFTIHGRRHLPRWQFLGDTGETIPGLPAVVRAIPANLHPLAIDSFMTTARPDFDGRSPVDFLATGANPAVVADWLEAIGHG